MTDWNHFFGSLRKYLEYFRSRSILTHQTLGPSSSYNNGGMAATTSSGSSNTQTISNSELAGLMSWTRLATAIAQQDPESRRQMYEERNWNCVETVSGMLACPVPLVLKQALYELLAALAIDEIAAVNIWNCLLCEGICVARTAGGKLGGIQQDLEDQECQLRVYNCTQGFLTLLKALMAHKTRPGTHQVAPYIQFVVNSILCQFSTRSYADAKQMWTIVKLALDCLYEPLRTFYATPVVVQSKCTEVQVLAQLLNDSSLSRSLLQIVVEGADRLQDEDALLNRCAARDSATFSALRLFYMAVCHRAALADAIRAVQSDLLVVSVESLLFSAIPHPLRANTNYMSLLFQYLSEFHHLARHTFYVLLMLKEACAQRPSLQSRIVQSLLPRRAQLIASVATLTSVLSADEICISVTDLLPQCVDDLPVERLRGELCRLIFEVFNDAMESEPQGPNIVYALMNFDLSNLQNTTLDIPNESGEGGATCLHNLLYIAEQLAMTADPFSLQFSGLFEPVLRLLLRLCSVRSACSSLFLRFLRSQYDHIHRLAASAVFRSIELPSPRARSPIFRSSTPDNATISPSILRNGTEDETALEIVHKSIQGVILELIALEMSSLLRTGHIQQPQRYLRILLSQQQQQNDVADQTTTTFDPSSTNGGAESEQKSLLWLLLDASRIFVEDIGVPVCAKFDTQKVMELLNLCIRRNSFGIDQYDVVYLHLLLNSELNCIVNTEIGVIRQEARAILDFCVRRNARSLLEGACVHLLQGWLSVVNVLALHVPLPFIDTRLHQFLLVDALFLLREYCRCVEMSTELAASMARCICRIVRAICEIFAAHRPAPDLCQTRQSLLPILHLLLQCIVLPGYSKSVAFKMQLYTGCLRVLDMCNPMPSKQPENQAPTANGTQKLPDNDNNIGILGDLLGAKVQRQQPQRQQQRHGGDPLVAMVNSSGEVSELWTHLFGPLTHEIVQSVCTDIMFAPLSLKLLATATFIDVLREDIRHEGRMVREFVYSGCLQCVQDALERLEPPEQQQQPPQPRATTPATPTTTKTTPLGNALRSLITMARACVGRGGGGMMASA